MIVYAGSNKRKRGYRKEVNSFSGKLFAHPNWKDPSQVTNVEELQKLVKVHHDIALIKLESKLEQVKYGLRYQINPICLPKRGEYNSDEENATFFGWGLQEAPNNEFFSRSLPDHVRRGDVLLVNSSECPKHCSVQTSPLNLKNGHFPDHVV